jgi:hypothetical protein
MTPSLPAAAAVRRRWSCDLNRPLATVSFWPIAALLMVPHPAYHRIYEKPMGVSSPMAPRVSEPEGCLPRRHASKAEARASPPSYQAANARVHPGVVYPRTGRLNGRRYNRASQNYYRICH